MPISPTYSNQQHMDTIKPHPTVVNHVALDVPVNGIAQRRASAQANNQAMGAYAPHINASWHAPRFPAEPPSTLHHDQRLSRPAGCPFPFPFTPHLSPADIAATFPVQPSCFLCDSPNHWYTRCPMYDGSVLFFYSETDHGLHMMCHRSWLHSAQVLDVQHFIRGATGLAPLSYELVVNGLVVPHWDPSVRCCELSLLPGNLVLIVLTHDARMALQARDTLLRLQQQQQEQVARWWLTHRTPSGSGPSLEELIYGGMNAGALEQRPGGVAAVREDAPLQPDADATGPHSSSASTEGAVVECQRRHQRSSGGVRRLVDQTRLLDADKHQDISCDDATSGERSSSVQRTNEAKHNNLPSKDQKSQSPLLTSFAVTSHLPPAPASQHDKPMEEHPPSDPAVCETNRSTVLHDLSQISIASTSLLRSLPATTTSVGDTSGHEGSHERVAGDNSARQVGPSDDAKGVPFNSPDKVKVWADLSVAIDTTATPSPDVDSCTTPEIDERDCERRRNSAVVLPGGAWGDASGVAKVRSMSTVVKDTPPPLRDEQTNDHRKEKRAASRHTTAAPAEVNGGATCKAEHTYKVHQKAEHTPRVSRTVHYKFLPSTMPFPHMRHMFFAAGVVHKVRLVDPHTTTGPSLEPKRSFSLAFVEYATVAAAKQAIDMFDRLKLQRFRLALSMCSQEIAGRYPTDGSDDGTIPCTFGAEDRTARLAPETSKAADRVKAAMNTPPTTTSNNKDNSSGGYRLTPKVHTSPSTPPRDVATHHNTNAVARTPQTAPKQLMHAKKHPHVDSDDTAGASMITFSGVSQSKTNDVLRVLFGSTHRHHQGEDRPGPLAQSPALVQTPLLHPVVNMNVMLLPNFQRFVRDVVAELVQTGVVATYYNAVREAERLSVFCATTGNEQFVLDVLLIRCAMHVRFGTPSADQEAASLARDELIPAAMMLLSSSTRAQPAAAAQEQIQHVVVALVTAAAMLQVISSATTTSLLCKARDLLLHQRPSSSLAREPMVTIGKRRIQAAFGPAVVDTKASSTTTTVDDYAMKHVCMEQRLDAVIRQYFHQNKIAAVSSSTTPTSINTSCPSNSQALDRSLPSVARSVWWVGKHLFPSVYEKIITCPPPQHDAPPYTPRDSSDASESVATIVECVEQLAMKVLTMEPVLDRAALGL